MAGVQQNNRLASASYPDPSPMPGGPISASYSYDDSGHCLSEGDTEQFRVDGGKQTTISTVDSPNEFAQLLKLSLPNPSNARLFQDLNLGMSLGPYSAKTNSCITHVGDVLRAGGITDVPRTTLDTIRFLKKQQGER